MKQEIRQNITNLYKYLIDLRKKDETLVYGNFKLLNTSKDLFIYARELNGKEYVIECNLSNKNKKAKFKKDYKLIYPYSLEKENILGPYEARIYVNK